MSETREQPVVEMRPAFVFTCEACGRDNFMAGIVPEMSQEDMSELREDYGIDEHQVGTFLMMPRKVQCQQCGVTYKTHHMSEDE